MDRKGNQVDEKRTASSSTSSLKYTEELSVVIEQEQQFLRERHDRFGYGSPDEVAPWGMAFSGGGVRSATFCLSVLQRLTHAGVFKKLDYLSTVSGGGYLGSCLSSLLSGESNEDTPPGIEAGDSPFVGLNETDEYVEEPRLGVRHQMHHLRTHGKYLIRETKLLSRDVQRAVGALAAGVVHNVLMFVVALVAVVAFVHLSLTTLDADLTTLAPTKMQSTSEDGSAAESGAPANEAEDDAPADSALACCGGSILGTGALWTSLRDWYDAGVHPVVAASLEGFWSRLRLRQWLPALLCGALWTGLWSLGGLVVVRRIGRAKGKPRASTRSGWNIEDHYESNFIRGFNVSSLLVVVALTVWLTLGRADPFLPGLWIPFWFAAGGAFVAFLVLNYAKSYALRSQQRQGAESIHVSGFLRRPLAGVELRQLRTLRSLYSGLQGAATYGMVATVLTPLAIIVALSLTDLKLQFFVSLLSVTIGWATARGRGRGDTRLGRIFRSLQKPLTNLALMVFLMFAGAWVSEFMLWQVRTASEGPFAVSQHGFRAVHLLILTASIALLMALGWLINSNRISLHYFYRDRLAEAYLKTDARKPRGPDTNRQGMPLTVLRNDSALLLKDLGEGNGRGPYHLIVTALNLAGSKELNRKTFLSEHFVFSKHYCGSPITGYVPTEQYHGGRTELARSMTISAAAVGSAMGYHTFWAQAFFMTLVNARLGYWMDNPWLYRPRPGSDSNSGPYRTRYWTSWPYYLCLELFGLTNARTRLVNLSDGGHTGDNLGLLPLLQRRCGTIIVCDAEADPHLAFGSFNNAVRMAYIEDNIRIEIDLTPIATRKEENPGYRLSRKSVVTDGKIHYPDGSKGNLIYIKSSVPKPSSKLPVHVGNYLKRFKRFPHQSTGDQYFDDAQFEAYRALGEHVAQQAVDSLDTTEANRGVKSS